MKFAKSGRKSRDREPLDLGSFHSLPFVEVQRRVNRARPVSTSTSRARRRANHAHSAATRPRWARTTRCAHRAPPAHTATRSARVRASIARAARSAAMRGRRAPKSVSRASSGPIPPRSAPRAATCALLSMKRANSPSAARRCSVAPPRAARRARALPSPRRCCSQRVVQCCCRAPGDAPRGTSHHATCSSQHA